MSTSDKSNLVALCRKYSDLTEQDIESVVRKARAVDELAEVFDCDIFIDVPLEDSTASIVVYHVLPVTKQSLYNKSPVGQQALKMNEPGVWKVSRSGGALKDYQAITQENVFIKQNIHAITHEGKVLGTYIMESAYHEKQEADNELNDYMTMTAKLNNYLDDPIYFFDELGNVIFQNEKADALTGQTLPEGTHYDQLFNNQVTYHDLILNEQKHLQTEIFLNGSYYLMKRILVEGDKLNFVIILRDITQLKNKEAEIISKTEAIRETHHRIKNNLQTMGSLLRMERRRSDNPEVKELLTENMNRVISIAGTHDILARQLGDQVELSEVLEFVINNLRRSYSLMDNIELAIDLQDSVVVPSDVATSVSLIVNELIQNCYNHAFPGGGEGRINVSLKREAEEVVIAVNDNGVGFRVDQITGNSLGLIIVQNYVKDKLNGSIQFNKRKQGMNVTFRFK